MPFLSSLCLDWDESRLSLLDKIERLLDQSQISIRLDLGIGSPVIDVSLRKAPFTIKFFLGLPDQPSGLVVKEGC